MWRKRGHHTAYVVGSCSDDEYLSEMELRRVSVWTHHPDGLHVPVDEGEQSLSCQGHVGSLRLSHVGLLLRARALEF